MKVKNNNIVVQNMKWHSTFTDLNHLGMAALLKPEVFRPVMDQIFTSQLYSNNPFTQRMVAGNSVKTISNLEWEWTLKGRTQRPMILLENMQPDSDTTSGKGRTTIRAKFDEDWRVPGDIITPGTPDYKLRVMSAPVKHGDGYVYELRLVNDGFNAFLPSEYLIPGTEYVKYFSQYEEGSEQSGSTDYGFPISLRNRMSRYRKHYRVTGDAATTVLAFDILDRNNKPARFWMYHAEAEFWQQWYQELERGYWYSTKNSTIEGSTGRPLYTGSGIREQLGDSHQHKYNHLSAKLIEEFIMDMTYNRISPETTTVIEGWTGEYGLLIFSRAMQDYLEKRGWALLNSDFSATKKSNYKYHSNAYSVGFQFKEFLMPNNRIFRLNHNPMNDDRSIHRILDPATGYPVESQRITIMDLAGKGATSNVSIIKKEKGHSLWYVAGAISPFGPAANTLGSHAGDYYEVHVKEQCGVDITDVTRCGELIKNT